MAQSQEKPLLTHNSKPVSFSTFKKKLTEILKEKPTSINEAKYRTVLEIVGESNLEYDLLKLFNRLIPNLLRVRAKSLILAILRNPPIYDSSCPHQFIKSFEAYKEFCINLLSFDCSCITQASEIILSHALKF